MTNVCLFNDFISIVKRMQYINDFTQYNTNIIKLRLNIFINGDKKKMEQMVAKHIHLVLFNC